MPKMSIFNYFKPKQIVPSKNSEIAELLGPSVLNEANESVLKIIESPTKVQNSPKTPASVTRGKYITYSSRDRADIGKYCSQHGPASTVRNYKEMFPNLNESTVCGMKKKYESLNLKKRKLDFEGDITELHPKKCGRPLLVGAELDTKVQKYVTVFREITEL